jgi:hypothetical protein
MPSGTNNDSTYVIYPSQFKFLYQLPPIQHPQADSQTGGEGQMPCLENGPPLILFQTGL